MNKENRGMYSRLADKFYKDWKAKEPRSMDWIGQIADAKSDFTLVVTVNKEKGRYFISLAIIRYEKYVIAKAELLYLDDEMWFDDWYQALDINYAVVQGMLDELGTEFVIDYDQWQDRFWDIREDEEFKQGNALVIDLATV